LKNKFANKYPLRQKFARGYLVPFTSTAGVKDWSKINIRTSNNKALKLLEKTPSFVVKKEMGMLPPAEIVSKSSIGQNTQKNVLCKVRIGKLSALYLTRKSFQTSSLYETLHFRIIEKLIEKC
jgi:hypothetical protein